MKNTEKDKFLDSKTRTDYQTNAVTNSQNSTSKNETFKSSASQITLSLNDGDFDPLVEKPVPKETFSLNEILKSNLPTFMQMYFTDPQRHRLPYEKLQMANRKSPDEATLEIKLHIDHASQPEIKIVKMPFNRKKLLLKNFLGMGYDLVKLEASTILTGDSFIYQLLLLLLYDGKPTNEQIAEARVIAQIIPTAIASAYFMHRINKNKSPEAGFGYHLLNVIGQTTFTMLLIFYLVSLKEQGEMPNNAKNIAQLTGIIASALVLALLTYYGFRQKIYQTDYFRSLSPKAQKIFSKIYNSISEFINGASTAEMFVLSPQLMIYSIMKYAAQYNPYTMTGNIIRWTPMTAWGIYRAVMEIKDTPDTTMQKIWNFEWGTLTVSTILYFAYSFDWIKKASEKKDGSNSPYFSALLIFNALFIMATIGFSAYKSHNLAIEGKIYGEEDSAEIDPNPNPDLENSAKEENSLNDVKNPGKEEESSSDDDVDEEVYKSEIRDPLSFN